MQRTFAMIKPDAVQRNLSGAILADIQAAGLTVVGIKMVHLSKAQAQSFYAVHAARPFFDSLTSYMCSGPVLCLVLQAENAIARYRDIMGATNPAQAAEGTLRKKYALNLEANAVHGSDAPETASFEIGYFFSALELVG